MRKLGTKKQRRNSRPPIQNEPHEEEAEASDRNEHAEHSNTSGGHMQHMKEVRDWLKEELEDKYDQLTPPATEE